MFRFYYGRVRGLVPEDWERLSSKIRSAVRAAGTGLVAWFPHARRGLSSGRRKEEAAETPATLFVERAIWPKVAAIKVISSVVSVNQVGASHHFLIDTLKVYGGGQSAGA